MNAYLSRDERETSLAGDRLAYIVMSFGLLAIVAYRASSTGSRRGSCSRC